MSNPLSRRLEDLTQSFVTSLVEALQKASLADVLEATKPGLASASRPPAAPHTASSSRAPSSAPAPRAAAPRRAADGRLRATDTAGDAALIVNYFASHPGTNAEAARKSVGLEKNRWSTCLYRAIRDGKVRTRGHGRGTQYWAV